MIGRFHKGLRSIALNFGFLLFPDPEELDLVGPREMAAMWSQYADGFGVRS